MPRPRSQQISLSDTPYYHVTSRTVRKAFLCGVDKDTGVNYEHRRDWVEKRILKLSSIFGIDIAAYAVMHNHLHVVLHVDVQKTENWNIKEVITRWHEIFRGTLLTKKYLKGQPLTKVEMEIVESTASIYRNRLMDISWFMRSLNEPIARQANKEDDCTGPFWGGRFKSQALLDETALLSCMAYVDLNPIRAGIDKTPEQSMYTSLKRRVVAAIKGEQPKELLSFVGNRHKQASGALCFRLEDYLTLVDETGRIFVHGKGSISPRSEVILSRLSITRNNWLKITRIFEQTFSGAAGSEDCMNEFAKHVGLKRIPGLPSARICISNY
jgi:REP element-mobilizing transposase RayT